MPTCPVKNCNICNHIKQIASQFINDFIKKHFNYIKYLTKNLVPNHCTNLLSLSKVNYKMFKNLKKKIVFSRI